MTRPCTAYFIDGPYEGKIQVLPRLSPYWVVAKLDPLPIDAFSSNGLVPNAMPYEEIIYYPMFWGESRTVAFYSVAKGEAESVAALVNVFLRAYPGKEADHDRSVEESTQGRPCR